MYDLSTLVLSMNFIILIKHWSSMKERNLPSLLLLLRNYPKASTASFFTQMFLIWLCTYQCMYKLLVLWNGAKIHHFMFILISSYHCYFQYSTLLKYNSFTVFLIPHFSLKFLLKVMIVSFYGTDNTVC